MESQQQALYRFFDHNGRLLYVGISADPGRRWVQHQKGKAWWEDVARVDLEQYVDRETVLAAEGHAIATEAPLYNATPGRQLDSPPLPIRRSVDPSSMPDDCHDRCVPAGWTAIYYPYAWSNGRADYECEAGHRWFCGWAVAQDSIGAAPEWRGVAAHPRRRIGDER